MKSNLTLVLIATALVSLVVCPTRADAQMNYQGRLTDNVGVALTAASADLTFNIYNVPAAGAALWGPVTFTGVDLINGRFNVVLPSSDGSGPNLATALAGTAYVHITVDGNAGLPRQQVYAAPKALNAELATHAGTASNFVSGVLYTRDFDGTNWNTEDGLTQGTERVGVGTQQPNALLDVNGDMNIGSFTTNSDRYLNIQTGGGNNYRGGIKLRAFSEDHGFDIEHDERHVSNGLNILRYNGTSPGITSMFIRKSDGKVGIGTTTPSEKLHVHGGRMRISDSGAGVLELSNGTELNFVFTDSVGQLVLSTDTAKDIVLQELNNGGVRIGNGIPVGEAKLTVGAGVSAWTGNTRYFDYSATLFENASGATYANISILATNDIHTTVFRAYSDARIKNIEGRSDAATDLATLTQLEIADYRYKDVVNKGNSPHKKVIAQQVETVFPQAVTLTTDVVPDIYQNATIANGWVTLTTDLKKGERVRLIGEKKEGIHEVLEVKEGQFRTDFDSDTDKVFVFGREVDDFRSVDYEAIAMLNVSATQELHRQLAAKSEEISTLEQRLAALEAKDKAHDEKFAKLERLLEGASKVIPVSID